MSAVLLRALCKSSGFIFTSVVINASIVAILGFIIPLPLLIPPIWQVFPSRVNSTASSFLRVSVVIIASHASELPSSLMLSTRVLILFLTGSIDSFCPITPVEPTIISFLSIPSSFAHSSHICSAISMPFELQVFALPLFTITACAIPFLRCSLVTMIGAPLTLF